MEKPVENKVLRATGISSWQLRAFFSMAIFYLFYYFCKYNLGIATAGIQDEFGFTSKTFGWVTTIFSLTYAGGQFINGFLGDRYGPKLIMIIGGLGGIVANVCFGLSGTLTFFVAFWMVNAYFSSCGWAPGCRIVYNWFPENRWGTWMGLFNALCYTGGALVLPIVGLAIMYWGWRAAFFVAPSFLLVMAIAFSFLGKGSPQDAGLEPQWEQKKPEKPKRRIGAREYWIAFTNLKMNLSYLSGFGTNFVRWGIISWMVKILSEPVEEGGFGLSIFAASAITSLAHWGGAFFSIILGAITDRVFKGSRWQTIMIGFILGALPLFYIAKGPVILDYPMGLFLLGVAMFISGGLIQGIQSPLFNLPADILGKEMSGTGVGIMDGWMYVGAAFAGVFLGWWMDSYGLTSGVMLMAVVSVVSGLLAIPIQK